MKSFYYFCITVSLALLLVTLSGCATLSKSECLTADWQIIGLEDGANGRPTSYIGNHRSACADYGVKPDLNAYLAGHKNGVRQYCSYQTGYNLGERGSSYNKVCPKAQYSQFAAGYERGRTAFQLKSEARELKNSFDSLLNRLADIEALIDSNEALIIADTTPPERRKLLLDEVKDLNSEAAEIKLELPGLEEALYQAELRYERYISRQK
ncbi:DUF2799 domain-containing protein [Aliikangiella marina]|uniref:DUF2799 domain-containing protein n=1 Tax=Aliikangiella marina TaxID=1712262 RepID=A0A545TH80_9GAMM|nr:DUF2799 domain-containing protein [Aliikangiella marina]TQV76582.1 DUF2799 domain-containing protein [Aliikangiella marina]